ncbi:WD repeat-containing protein 44-like isoform X1 [Papaver somniferum]|uniref:WD repeat-containing protein 44-like isoform X1 n=1 Tax=Papaver somniferum TaxID=3469 RepID=UPI000E6FBCB1|nr:WD repeat-containing protein 44-like isoform X1 [Papaver somniferum]
MSRQKGGQEEEEEEEEEEESEEECFYESLDRIVSSSSTCTSSSSSSVVVSEDEENVTNNKNQPIIPRFPISHYDVWISQPTSIEERRQKLLHDMGLASGSSPDIDYGRSISSDQLQQGRVNSSTSTSNCAVARSKSDGADCRDSSPCDHCSNSSIPSASSNSIQSQSNNNGNSVVDNKKLLLSKSRRRSNESIGGGSPTANAVSSLSKPPSGKLSRKVDDMNSNLDDVARGGEQLDEKLNTNGNVKDREVEELDPSCMIKNLDTGTEFVVNEVREDGLCDKVREVGTDRQLTLEEFERFVGHSPIVQELMRRQNVEEFDDGKDDLDMHKDGDGNPGLKTKKKGSWFKSIKKNVASVVTGQREKKSSDERDTSSEKGGRRSSSATDESQDGSFHGPERVRVRQYGKSFKDLTALFKSQEIQAHGGSVWSIKFSLDGRYLASAGEDCVIHVWQVVESERKGDFYEKLEDGIPYNCLPSGSPEPALLLSNMENNSEKKRRGRKSISRKSISLDQVKVPESVFALSEKPICSFRGHLDDVLDLSWSKSQLLLSSSMDKTVRLWHMASNSCLKIFSHSDYVTCIQFNPVDDRYFISGSLDAKVRIWSIPDRQVVDWNDLNEMVTAACYTPDGQGALVGSYKGNCRLYDTSENKLHPKSQINLQNKKKKSHHRKITGFQFAPGSSTEVLVTSADSRIRVIDGADLVHKFKGFRNSSSQISASVTANGKYVVSASENSNVYVWKHEGESRPSRTKGVTVTQSYEHFHCQDVSVAIPWTGLVGTNGPEDENSGSLSLLSTESSVNNHSTPALVHEANNKRESSPSLYGRTNSPCHGTIASVSNSYFFDKFSATWPEEKLVSAAKKRSPNVSTDFSTILKQGRSAWGMVIVTAGLRGEIRTFQNFGLPVRI